MRRLGFVFLVALVLGITPLVHGQDASEGILPIPDYSGDLVTRSHLTGDWGGVRTDWAKSGFTLGLDWTQVGQDITSGGADERCAYAGNIDYHMNFDLMRMGLLPGALITFRGQSRYGETVNGDTGVLLPVNLYSSNPMTREVDDNVGIAVTELNLTQFLSPEFALLLGKVTTMRTTNEFMGGEGRTQFMNFQFSMSAVTALVGPYSAPAVGAIWMPSPHVTVTNILINTNDASTTSGFGDIGDGTTWSASVETKYTLGGMPGGATLSGMYAFDNEFTEIGGFNITPEGGLTVGEEDSAWGIGIGAWQYLWTETDPPAAINTGDGMQDLEGLGVFLSIGIGDRKTNPVSFSIAGGLSGRGLIPGRDNDTCGLGYFYNALQEPDFILFDDLSGSTQGLEAYYNIALMGAASLTLDFQWTKSAIDEVDDAIILGLRLNLRF